MINAFMTEQGGNKSENLADKMGKWDDSQGISGTRHRISRGIVGHMRQWDVQSVDLLAHASYDA
jgi:hypothetical protein